MFKEGFAHIDLWGCQHGCLRRVLCIDLWGCQYGRLRRVLYIYTISTKILCGACSEPSSTSMLCVSEKQRLWWVCTGLSESLLLVDVICINPFVQLL